MSLARAEVQRGSPACWAADRPRPVRATSTLRRCCCRREAREREQAGEELADADTPAAIIRQSHRLKQVSLQPRRARARAAALAPALAPTRAPRAYLPACLRRACSSPKSCIAAAGSSYGR